MRPAVQNANSIAAATKDWLVRHVNRTGIEPGKWIAEIENTYPHKESSFTQGLEFSDGILYESTGMKGQSMVAQVDPRTGDHSRQVRLGPEYFGEGITILGDSVYNLTWQDGKCFIFDKDSLEPRGSFGYEGEGWGLCNDGSIIMMSNGTDRLAFREPGSFRIKRSIRVRDNHGPVSDLNELEYIDGMIFANVWPTNRVVVIHPEDGIVVAEIDGTGIERIGRLNGGPMNGIAHDPTSGMTYFTGKNWPKMVETFVKKVT